MSKLPRRARATEEGLKELREAQERMRQVYGRRFSYEDIAEKAFVHRSTVSRLFTGKKIDTDNIRAICEALNMKDWQKIVSLNGKPQQGGLEITLTGSIDEVTKRMSGILTEALQEASGDVTVSIRIIRSGSIIVVIDGTPEGLERIKSLYEQGDLTEVAGFPVENVQFESEEFGTDNFLDLGQWLKNNFTEAIEAGWRSLEAFPRTMVPALRLRAKKLAKSIELKDNCSIILAMEVAEEEDEEIQVMVKLYPGEDLTYLPDGLQVNLITEDGEIIEIEVEQETRYLEQEIICEPEEEFHLQLVLENVVRTEEFVV